MDRHANFRADVECYTKTDPMPTLRKLSASTDIPVETLVRYVLVKWAASGSEALLAMYGHAGLDIILQLARS